MKYCTTFFVLILIFVILIDFYSCGNDTPTPHDCVTFGDCEIMTCKLNGKDWKAECEKDNPWGCNDPVYCSFNRKTGFLSIVGKSVKEPNAGVNFSSPINGGFVLGKQSLSNYTVVGCSNCDILNIKNGSYKLDSVYLSGNHIELLKIDSTYNVVEGKFNFRAINHTYQDTIYVTEGYFKLHFL